jgi:hypothetical protein
MVAPIFVVLGIFGGIVALPNSIDPASLAELRSDSYAIVGTSELMKLDEAKLFYPEVRAEYIYGGLTWDSFKPRIAVTASARGDLWAGAGVDYEKYWSIGNDKAFFIAGSFLPGLYKQGQIDLGSVIEFRSQLEIGIVQKGGWRLSAYIEHRSNASISRFNPGIEAFGANFGFNL